MKRNRLAIVLSAAAIVAPVASNAEQVTDTTAPYSAAARLDFRVIIPAFLYFRVGTADATVNQITFDMTATPGNVGNSTAVAGTSGDAAGTGVNVVVRGNNGQITITETNNSGGNGMGTGTATDGYISFAEISTTASVAQLPAPTLSNAGGGTALPTLNAGKVTNRTGVWNFSYLNTTTPGAGTYGTSANGGRVTYTATMP